MLGLGKATQNKIKKRSFQVSTKTQTETKPGTLEEKVAGGPRLQSVCVGSSRF